MSLRQVTVGVIGSGKVSDTLVCDALCEHFVFGPADAEGYFAKSLEFDVHLILPVGRDSFTEGIEAVWQWAMRCELPFLALSDGSASELTEQVRESVLDPADWQMSLTPQASIVTLLTQASNPLLLVISEDGHLDDELRGHVTAALSAGIPVYDLARALLEQTWEDLGLEPPQQEPQPQVTEEPGGQLALAVGGGEPYVVTGEQARTVTGALGRAYCVIQELAQLAREAEELRPLLAAAERALRPLEPLVASLAPDPSPGGDGAAPEQTAAPEQAGPSGRTRLEIYDEATGQWRPAGRGRPRQGVRTRRVPK